MMNSVKDPVQETQLDNPIRSPFHLNKSKAPVKLIPLNATLRESGSEGVREGVRESGSHGTSLSQSTSATSSTTSIGTTGSSETMSPKGALGENPFSFNLQKIGSINLSPRSSLASSDRLIEYQKEIAKLKKDIEIKNKDIESKDLKLSSTVKSIKQFWSPELKKERALRKEEAERSKFIKEQCQIGNNQIEEYKCTLQDLESELSSQQDEIKSLLHRNDDKNTETNNLQIEIKELAAVHEKVAELEDTNKRLCDEIKEKSNSVIELEKIINKHEKKEEENIINEQKIEEQRLTHNNITNELATCKHELKSLQDLNRKHTETETLYEQQVASLQEKLYALTETLNEKEQLQELTQSHVDDLQGKEKEYCEQVAELEDMFAAKDRECNKLQGEIAALKQAEAQNRDLERLNALYKHDLKETSRKAEFEADAKEKLNEKIKELRHRLDSDMELKEESVKLHRKLGSLEKEVSMLCEEKRKVEEELTCAINAQQESENTYDELKDAHETFVKEFDKLKDVYEMTESQKVDLETERSSLLKIIKTLKDDEEELKEVREINKNYLKERELLVQQNIEIEEKVKEVEGKLDREIFRNIKLKKSEEELRNSQVMSDEYIKELKEKHRKSYSEKTSSKEQDEKIVTILNSKNKVQEELNKLKKTKDTHDSDLRIFRDKYAAIQKENDENIAALKQAEAQNRDLERLNASYKHDLKETSRKAEFEADAKEKLNEKLKELRHKLDSDMELKEESVRLHRKLGSLEKENVEMGEKISDYEYHIAEMEKDLQNAKSLGSLSSELQEKVTDYEQCIAEMETDLQNAESMASLSSELKEELNTKTKEVNELSLKYDNLNKYLNERELALDNNREELTEIKRKNHMFINSNEQLNNQLNEQKVTIDKLQSEKIHLEKAKEASVPIAIHEKLKTRVEEVEKENNKKKILEEREEKLEEKLEELQNDLKEMGKAKDDLEEKVKESNNMVEQSEVDKINNEKEELTKEVMFLKLKISTLEKLKATPAGEEKPLVAKKNLWDELSRKDGRIDELEKQLKEKGRQLATMKKNKNTEWEKQQVKIGESKKVEEDVESLMAQLKADNEQKANRISLLEEALREMVVVAKERENIMARYAEVYEEVEKKYEEADREYARICFERAITNIKNALLLLILSEREALLSSMKASQTTYLEELFTLREKHLMSSISEKDDQIAHLESQSPKNKRSEIKLMREEKEKFVAQLKEQNNQRMLVLSSNDDKLHCITSELKEAPTEQIYEAIRHLTHNNTFLESKVEELITFLREKNAELLKDITDVPGRAARPNEQLKILAKDELLREMSLIEDHSTNLQKFVENLLTLLEGDQ